MGADPVAIAIARESLEREGEPINAFVVRKEPKAHGMKQGVEGLTLPAQIDVVVVDDVCSTGGSTVTAIEAAREAGMIVAGVLCLVDREQGGRLIIERALAEVPSEEDLPFLCVFTAKDVRKAHVALHSK